MGGNPEETLPQATEQAAERSPGVVVQQIREAVRSRLPLPAGEPVKIDRFTVLERIGSGGMGVVYGAYDPELDRKIAVKVLHFRGPSPDPEGRARLLREAQALARLSHPNVVAIYDVGTFQDSVFLAMEFAAGSTLAQWLATETRSWRDVLRILNDAGRGLAAAHAAGLVHRDFKPSNVIVGADGRVRVLDFGLARALGDESPESGGASSDPESSPGLSDPMTLTGTVLGTPAYMSPEQHRGEGAVAVSDQYSFCVTAFEALYRRRPFQGATATEIREAIERDEIVEPAPDGGVPGRVRRAVTRGLKVRAADRWPSMDALLAELERAARPSGRLWATALGVALGVASLGYVGVTRSRCEDSAKELDGVWDDNRRQTIAKAFAAVDAPFTDQAWETVSRTLDSRAAGWVEAHEANCKATDVEASQPDAVYLARKVCLERQLAELAGLVGVFAEADADVVELASAAVADLPTADACSAEAGLAPQVDPPADASIRVHVQSLRMRAARGVALRRAGRYADAVEHLTGLLAEAEPTGYRALAAELSYELALAQDQSADYEAAEASLLATIAAGHESHHDGKIAQAMIQLAFVVGLGQGQHTEGQRIARLARGAVMRAGTALDQAKLAYVDGRLAKALGDYELARRRYEDALARSPADSEAFVAEVRRELSRALLGLGQSDAALEHAQDSLALAEALFGPTNPTLSKYYGALGNVLANRGDTQGSEAHNRRAYEIALAAFGPDHPSVASAAHNLAAALAQLNRYDEAVPLIERALAIDERTLGREHPDHAPSLYSLATMIADAEPESAMEYLERAMVLIEAAGGPRHPNLPIPLEYMAQIVLDQGDADRAIALQQRSLAIWERTQVPPARRLIALTGLGNAYAVAGNPTAAKAHLESALAIGGKGDGDPLHFAGAQFTMARVLAEFGGDPERARELAAQARAAYQSAGPRGVRHLADVEAWLAQRDQPSN